MGLRPSSTAQVASDSIQQFQLIQEAFVMLDDGDRQALAALNLSPSQYRLLKLLDDQHGQRLTLLSERLLLAKSTVTRLVDQLVQMGWVARLDDPEDRRAQWVILTASGKLRLSEASTVYVQAVQERLEVLTGEEQRNLLVLLDKLCVGLRARLDTAGASPGAAR